MARCSHQPAAITFSMCGAPEPRADRTNTLYNRIVGGGFRRGGLARRRDGISGAGPIAGPARGRTLHAAAPELAFDLICWNPFAWRIVQLPSDVFADGDRCQRRRRVRSAPVLPRRPKCTAHNQGVAPILLLSSSVKFRTTW